MGSDKVIVLCEDTAQEAPIREWLKLLGYNTKREVRFLTDPSKTIDGKRNDNNHFVDKNYVEQVEALRARTHKVQCSLVVCRDADKKAVQVHLNAFDERLKDNQPALKTRGTPENIALLLPKSEIETWLVFLAGHDVNEDDDYKTLCRKVNAEESAKRFARLACGSEEQPADCRPSLKVALETECPRIPKR